MDIMEHMSNIKFSNPWMKLEESGDSKFIRSDDQRFRVTMVSDDINAINDHCNEHDDRGVIATDQDGLMYVAMFKSE